MLKHPKVIRCGGGETGRKWGGGGGGSGGGGGGGDENWRTRGWMMQSRYMSHGHDASFGVSLLVFASSNAVAYEVWLNGSQNRIPTIHITFKGRKCN